MSVTIRRAQILVVTVLLAASTSVVESSPAAADPGLIFVDASASGGNNGTAWVDAFVELQDALAVATSGDEIWVAEGTFLPDFDPGTSAHTGNTASSFVLPASTMLYGGFPLGGGDGSFSARNTDSYETVLSGDLSLDDGPDHTNTVDNAEFVIMIADNIIVDGVTVVGGVEAGVRGTANSVEYRNVSISGNHDSGMWTSGTFVMRDSRLADNVNDGAGGAMYIHGDGAMLVNVVVEDNVAGNGGGIFAGGPITIVNSIFRNNSACYDCSGGWNGGALLTQSSVTVVNTVFSGNRASYGSALRAIYGVARVTNCTFAGNDSMNGPTIDGLESDLFMANSIMWDNSGTGEIQDFDSMSVLYSIVEGGFAGTGVSTNDPDFIDGDGPDNVYGTADDNLRLGARSAAIDNGDNSEVHWDVADLDEDANTTEWTPVDLDWNQRFIDRPNADGGVGPGPIVDMGAYELPETPPVAVSDTYVVVEDETLIVSAPGVLGNDSDPEGDPITSILDKDSHGQVDLQSDGSFTYTPQPDWVGTDTFEYRADDGHRHSDPPTVVSITVTPVNDAPRVSDDDGPFIIPGQTSCSSGLLFMAFDPDGDPMTAHLYTDATHVDMSVNPDGTWCAEPDGTWPGSDSFQWRAHDGQLFSDPATVSLTTRPFDEVADLTLTKTASPDPVEVGELLRYTITIRNDGPDPATQVVATDTLSPLVAFSSASDVCVHEAGTVTCDIGTIAIGETVTLLITVTPVASGQIDNFVGANLHEIDADGSFAAGATVNATEPGAPTQRVAGLDRILTAIDASKTTYLPGEAGAVVLARSDLFPDALAGSVLTVAHQAPLLLTPSTTLDGRVESEIRRVLPTGGTVFLLGGEAALGRAIEERIEALGYQPVRLGGSNRYDTAVIIASAVPGAETILVATAQDFPDALAAGAAAAAVNGVVVLTNADTMPSETRRFINARAAWPRYAIGGPATRADPAAVPILGSNRYATAIAVAEEFFDDPVVVGVAVGTRFPDALGGAGHIGRRGGPMLLTDTTRIPTDLRSYLLNNRATIERAYIYGGPAAISLEVEATIRILIN